MWIVVEITCSLHFLKRDGRFLVFLYFAETIKIFGSFHISLKQIENFHELS